MIRCKFTILASALFMTALLFGGCSPRLYDQPMTFAADDMYALHDQQQIAAKREARLEAAALQREQRMAQWAEILGYNTSEPTIINTAAYNTPYGERLLALSAESYERPSSYYSLSYDEQTLLQLAEYDPSQYNIVIDELGSISVAPKYVSSMYGSWASSPYGATYGYYPLSYYDNYYYSAWGYPSWGYYPSYGWYDWRFGVTPYFGFSYYSRPPYHYRPYVSGVKRQPTIVKRADAYTSPSSRVGGSSVGSTVGSGSAVRRNSDGSSVGRSTGNTYNRGGSSSSSGSSVTRSTTTTPSRVSTPSSSSSSSSGNKTNSIGR